MPFFVLKISIICYTLCKRGYARRRSVKKKILFYDSKPYDKVWFSKLAGKIFDIDYAEYKLSPSTAPLARGYDAVVAFVNDDANRETIDALYAAGIRVLALRNAGYSNVDLKAAFGKINVLRVPEYSPYAVAEHAMALLLSVNRKIHKAYNRTRDFNFSLNGLTGTDLHGKTAGIIGTGKIGRAFIEICRGFGMEVIASDPYPSEDARAEYVELDELFRRSDVISLHCPLTESTHHVLDKKAFATMKDGVFIINTSRGALIDSEALLNAISSGKVGAAGLDVYEEEADLFFEDFSATIIKDDVLALLVSRPNVLITSHQAFLTDEALEKIAEVTLNNLADYFDGKPLVNEICYRCTGAAKTDDCPKKTQKLPRCF